MIASKLFSAGAEPGPWLVPGDLATVDDLEAQRRLKTQRARQAAMRQVIPWRQPANERPNRSLGMVAYDFMQENPAAAFYSGGPKEPGNKVRPTAGVLPK